MPNSRNIAYLIDGSSYIYRAYHAIRDLSNSKGFPVNAIFGFTKMILKLLSDITPEYIAIAFDTKEKTFRHKLYPLYKANRPAMPEDLILQIPIIKKIIHDLGLTIIEMDGFEADDIIGTAARSCVDKGLNVIIVTGDKDFRQLVSGSISLLDTMKNQKTTYESIIETYGIEPGGFIDLMGLSGDSSDNIPGVPGIGEKTALELIKQFGSFDNVFNSVDIIKKNKIRENLKLYQEQAKLSRNLVTINQHVPIDMPIDSFSVHSPNSAELSDIFRFLEFKDLLEKFTPAQKNIKTEYYICTSEKDLHNIINSIIKAGHVCIDTETTSENPHNAQLVGISLSWEEGKGVYIPVGHMYLGCPEQLPLNVVVSNLAPVLNDNKIKKIGQNIKYDTHILAKYGIEFSGINFDTMIASYVISPGVRQHNLNFLAQQYLEHSMITYEMVTGSGAQSVTFDKIQLEKAAEYSCEDADITLRLRHILDTQLKKDGNDKLFYELEMPLLPVLTDMERTGIMIDVKLFRRISADFTEQLHQLEQKIFERAGMRFNLNSSQQVGFILFEKLGLPSQKKTTKKTGYSTDISVLQRLASIYPDDVPDMLLRYRMLSKLKSTYLDALIKLINPKTGRIHTSFNQAVTATGRLSSSNPNLQNIPIRGKEGREIRKGFIAKDNCYLISADYSQIELRIFAHYSEDSSLIEAFCLGEDIHLRTAAEILNVNIDSITPDMRRIAKSINFGIIYGMGARKLANELSIDHKTAQGYLDSYYSRYKGVLRFREKIIEEVKKTGYATTLFNRRRFLPDINHKNLLIRSEAERMAINTPIQGTAADIIKKAMINIYSRIVKENLVTKLLLQVHDELVLEAPEEETDYIKGMVKEEMENVYSFSVPLKVDVNMGRNWNDAH